MFYFQLLLHSLVAPLFSHTISHFGFCCFSLRLLLCKTCMEIAKFFSLFRLAQTQTKEAEQKVAIGLAKSCGLRIIGGMMKLLSLTCPRYIVNIYVLLTNIT